jgi:RNA polymerase-binding transcription factor DksA
MAREPAPRPAAVLISLVVEGGAEVDTNAVRERLLKRRDELRQRASDASADLRHEADPLSADFAEQVTQRENDDVLGAISQSAQAELQQVEAALRRLASGRYSSCAVCGEDIEPERLAAVPYTDRCRTCAEGGRAAAGRGARG